MFKASNPENDHALIYASTAPCCEAKVSSRLGGQLGCWIKLLIPAPRRVFSPLFCIVLIFYLTTAVKLHTCSHSLVGSEAQLGWLFKLLIPSTRRYFNEEIYKILFLIFMQHKIWFCNNVTLIDLNVWNTVCSVTSLTLRYIVGKIGRFSLLLAKTARDDIINSIRENKLTFKNRNNGMRRWDALDKWDR